MIKTILISMTIIIMSMCGSMWYLGYLAFGRARVVGVETIPAVIFTGIVFLVIFFGIYTVFAATDWLNDWIASRSTNTDNVKQLKEISSVLTQQARAKLTQEKIPEGEEAGLDYSSDIFETLE